MKNTVKIELTQKQLISLIAVLGNNINWLENQLEENKDNPKPNRDWTSMLTEQDTILNKLGQHIKYSDYENK